MRAEDEYKVLRNTVRILAVLCEATEQRIVEELTGFLWDEEEAGKILRAKV